MNTSLDYPVIKFDRKYKKLYNQNYAELITVTYMDTNLLTDKMFNTLKEYECLGEDGICYSLQRQEYTVLIFVGDNGIVFQSLRDKSKFVEYHKYINHIFKVVIDESK